MRLNVGLFQVHDLLGDRRIQVAQLLLSDGSMHPFQMEVVDEL